jgi:hypothetical protein
MKKTIIPLLLAVVLVGLPASADTLTFSLVQSRAGNLFQTRDSGSDDLTTIGLGWEKSVGAFTLFAEADTTQLWKNTGLSDWTLSAGVDALKTLSEKTALYFSLEGGMLRYRDDYADFDRSGLRFTAAIKSYVSPSSIFKATAASEYRVYAFRPFDFFSQSVTASLDKYFHTRTTLKIEAGWGYKYFLHPYVPASSEPATETGVGVREAAGISSVALGYGSGGFGQLGLGSVGAGSSGGSAGRGAGSGQGYRGGYAISSDLGSGKGLQVFSLTGLLAQGLGDRFGLRIGGLVQRTLSGENPFTSVEEYTMVENPTYDAFSWQGWGWNAQATAALPWNIELRLGYTDTDKEFPGIESLDLAGAATGLVRRDHRKQFEARLEKTFSRWSIFVTYAVVRNASNDPLFEWRGPLLSAGFEWTLPIGRK